MTRRSVQGGYCATEGICAIEKQGCIDPSDYLSSREMRGAPDRAHGGVCLLQETVRGEPLGKCGNGDCAPNAESCLFGGDEFLTHLEKSSSCQVDTSFFGRCGPNRCAWSPDDCNTGEEWEFPVKACACDMVQVGACRKGLGEIHCAVSPDACDIDQAWIRPTEVIKDAGFNCFLCREKSNGDDSADDSGDGGGSKLNGNYGMTTRMEEKSNTGAIIGITVGVLASVSLIGVVGYKMSRKKNFGKEETVELP